jgi:hypothetical protein
MDKKNIIYGLTCPDTEMVRYIGKSTTGLTRPQRHKGKMSLIAKSHKNNWIKSLIAQNKIYGIKIIEVCDSKEILNEREVYWIKTYKDNGVNLTNSTEGGEGSVGFRFSEESKEKMSKIKKEWLKNNPEALNEIRQLMEIPNIEKDGEIYKHCSDCKEYVKIVLFHNDKNRKDGLRTICKTCACSRKNKYYSDNIEKLTPEQLKQSYESRKSAMSQGVKAAYENNPELRLKASQQRSKAILRIDPSTNQTKEYGSALKAKEDGFQNSNIGVAIKKRTLYKGYYWKFKANP